MRWIRDKFLLSLMFVLALAVCFLLVVEEVIGIIDLILDYAFNRLYKSIDSLQDIRWNNKKR